MKLKFVQNVNVAGIDYKDGAVVDENHIPAGSLKTLLRMGRAVYHSEPAQPAPAAFEEPTRQAEPPPAKTGKKK